MKYKVGRKVSKCILFQKIFYITTKCHPWPSLGKKNMAKKFTLVLFSHHALEYVFRTCNVDIFTLVFDLKKSNCQGSQKNSFLSVMFIANIGFSYRLEKKIVNCVMLCQYCLKNILFPQNVKSALLRVNSHHFDIVSKANKTNSYALL